MALTEDNPALCEAIDPKLPDIKAQVVYAIESESAHNLVDILRRRTTIAMNGHYGLNVLSAVTETLEKHCGWTKEKSESRNCRLSFLHGTQLHS